MKLTKSKLKEIIREEIQKLDEKKPSKKHPKIPGLGRYIALSDPDYDPDYEDEDSFGELTDIERKAKSLGLYDELQRAVTIAHYGRGLRGWDYIEPDHLKRREAWIKAVKNRITKDNKLNKNSVKWLKNQIKRYKK